MTSITTKDYWMESYRGYFFEFAKNDDPLRKWLEHLHLENYRDCFEIGYYPGKYLSVLGKMGLEVNGIDIIDGKKNKIDEWLRHEGINVGSLITDDFENYISNKKYDIVTSFGFIEHFKNWDEILVKQLSMVKPGGIAIIEVPNFSSLPLRTIHFLFNNINLRYHNLKAMDISSWIDISQNKGFATVFSGPIGKFDYWLRPEPGLLRKFIFKFFNFFIFPFIRRLDENILFSSYVGVVLERKK